MPTNSGKVMSFRAILPQYNVYKFLIINVRYCWIVTSDKAYKLLLIINKLHKQVPTNSGKVMSFRAILPQYNVYKFLIINVRYC